ncbi:alpha-galactosidase [Paenibacillus mendelii]|uniref:Alpha-galactosidase n=1 Tax=Paenibacillus mendelii TaxID=206163 RepID=A0ABV6J700_9BACL|nr:alpha-galactosidase [Paenibacillus mendelii]MCQ6560977.1 alpha-galactosidase [Paenibacillus mendelii]
MNQSMRHAAAEPPIAQANHSWDEETNLLQYHYNGRTIISIPLPEGVKAYYRRVSDGNLQTSPFVQQLYLAFERPQRVRVTFELSEDAINMRPRRAADGEAILGQSGRPTIYGANGLYDVLQDLLIDWHGADWRWACDRIRTQDNGNAIAEIDVEVGVTPWIINLRMHYYRKHLNFSYHKPWEWRPNLKPVSGWCSWEAYRRDIEEADVLSSARFISDHFKAYGLEYVQLDDGFQPSLIPQSADGTVAEAWLRTNEKFPSGHEGLTSGIKECGLQPGIWTNAVVTNPDFAALSDSCIKDQEGSPIKGKWIGYVLDCTPETLARHVAPYYRGMNEFGYTYFKTDAIRHLIYDGLHEAVKEGLISNDEAEAKFRAFLACAKEQIGDAYLLSCWGVFSEVVGLADACRIATDSNPSWPAIRMQLVETARWFHTHRILFLNDPDHVCVRAPMEWAKSAISLVALTGSLLMISDKPENYDDERIHMIRRNLPPLSTVTAETGALDINYPAFAWTHVQGYAIDLDKADQQHTGHGHKPPVGHPGHPFTTLWAIHMQTTDRTWCVAGRFATEPLQASVLEIAQLGLNPAREYAVFDFWQQQYMGRYTESIPCHELEVGSCQIMAVCPVDHKPVLLASSRHVSMDAISVLHESWDNGLHTLKLAGVPGTSENYWYYVPAGFTVLGLSVDNGQGDWSIEGETVKLTICFTGEETLSKLSFGQL